MQQVRNDIWRCFVLSQVKISRILHGGVKIAWECIWQLGGGGGEGLYPRLIYSGVMLAWGVLSACYIGAAGEFSSQELSLCADCNSRSVPPPPTHPPPTPCVTVVVRKRPRSLGQKCRLHVNTHTSLTQRSRIKLAMPLSGPSVETYPETSSHATWQGTFGPSRLRSLSHCGLILT